MTTFFWYAGIAAWVAAVIFCLVTFNWWGLTALIATPIVLLLIGLKNSPLI